MPIYLSTKAIPELHGYSKAQRRTFIARAMAANAWNPFVWLGYGLMGLGLFAAMTAAVIFIPAARTFLPFGLLVGLGLGGIFGVLGTQILTMAIRPTLATYHRELEHTSTMDDRHLTPID